MNIKVYEVTIKHLVCTDTKEHAEEEMLRRYGSFHLSMETRELPFSEGEGDEDVICVHPETEELDVPF